MNSVLRAKELAEQYIELVETTVLDSGQALHNVLVARQRLQIIMENVAHQVYNNDNPVELIFPADNIHIYYNGAYFAMRINE